MALAGLIVWALPEGFTLKDHLPFPRLVLFGGISAAMMMTWVALYRGVALRRATEMSDVYTTTLMNAPTGFLIADMDGRIVTYNLVMARLCRPEGDRLARSTLPDLAGPDVWADIRAHPTELMMEVPLNVDIDIAMGEHTRYLTGEVRVSQNADGEPCHYILQLSDRTDQQMARQALHSATQQIRHVLANSSDLVFIVDGHDHVVFANASATASLDIRAAELAGQSIFEAVDKASHGPLKTALAAFRNESQQEYLVERLRLAGAPALTVSCQVVRLAAGDTPAFALLCKATEDSTAATQALRARQDRFSQVFHASPDAILIVRARDDVIVDFNEGFTRLLGYTREEAIGEARIAGSLFQDRMELEAVVEQLRETHEIIGYETTLRSKGGRTVHVQISLRYIDVDGELCTLCIGRDISQRISAEAALVETEEKFEKVFTHSPDGIVILRQADGHIMDLNEAFAARTGYDPDELVNQPFLDMFPADSEELTSAHRDLLEEGVFTNRGIALKTKNGTRVPYLVSATVMELSGEPCTMIIAKDMSRQRAAEARLRRSEERFRGIFENAPIGILLVDDQGRVFQTNRTAADLLGYEQQAMYGIHVSRLVPDDGRESLRAALAKLALSGISVEKSERRLVREDGLELWTSFQIVRQANAKDQTLYYIVQIADISDIKQNEARMEQMAFYDTLTNLANRRLFQDRLNRTIEHCNRHDRCAALLYLDLDNFKRVNDTLGHQAGDQLLREVASRLQQCVRREDTVGRSGGDEFTILLNEIRSPSDAGEVAQKILAHLREPLQVAGHPLIVTTSIGITVLPNDGADRNQLMSNADLAMYKAKQRGRNNFQFYSEDLNANAVRRLQTEYQIRNALDNGQFELYYQPKVCLRDQRFVGVECLIRWNHPERGLLSPSEFIDVAEEAGSIIELGTWIIEAACRAAATFAREVAEPVTLAVNISPRQFKDPNLVSTMRRCLREYALDPKTLELEITETMLMQDAEGAQTTVLQLSELGVKIAIDDFGTGYSSLNYLKRFPINIVKIDRSFVTGLPTSTDDMAITRAVIAMAHQLNMTVVAEGVESIEQYQFLAEQRCEFAQGYLFSRPLPMHEVIPLLDNAPALTSGAHEQLVG